MTADTAHLELRRHPERIAFAGILVNAVLAGVKLLAGVVGHSFALVADAAESLADIAGSLVIWGALRYGHRPPDEDHPFGHGKVEALAAIAVACFVVVMGIGIGAEAVRQIVTPHVSPAPFTLAVLVAVVVVKEAMFRVARRAARRAGSAAGHADAWHHRADAITSVFAMVGVGAALVGGPTWAPADDWAALAASFVIVFNGTRLFRAPYAELMDEHAPEVAAAVTAETLQVDGIRGVERCEARRSGRGYRVVMHAEVDPEMSVRDSHRLTGIVKQRVRSAHPEVDSVLIHVEPHESGAGAPPAA